MGGEDLGTRNGGYSYSARDGYVVTGGREAVATILILFLSSFCCVCVFICFVLKIKLSRVPRGIPF